MARGKAHSPEVKAQVMAALLAGQGVSEVARQYNLDTGTVSRWKKQIPQEQLQQVAAEKSTQLEEMVFGYLTENFRALTAQAKVASDPAYLKKQSADQLAVLHGVMADKAVRILEAAQAAGEPPPPDVP